MPFYFSYVVNADLAEGDANAVKTINGYKRTFHDTILHASHTVMMFELRSAASELNFLSTEEPGFNEKYETDQLRMKGDEKHFAGRHFEGGHMAFADGHAAHVKWRDSYRGTASVRWQVNSENYTGD